MNKLFARTTAVFLFSGAILGLLLSLGAIGLVFPVRARLVTGVGKTLEFTHNTLDTTSDLLNVMDNTLGKVDDSLTILVDSTRSISESLKTTADMASSIAGMVGNSFSTVLTETQNSLDTASKTARIIDDTLSFISTIPLIGAKYAPEKTLETTFKGISTSLDPMMTTLGDLRTDMDKTATDIGGIRTGLDDLADSLEEIDTSIQEAQTATQEYITTVDKLIKSVETAQKNYKTWLTIAAILTIIFFLWMAAAQVGLMMQAKAIWSGTPIIFTRVEKPASESLTQLEAKDESSVSEAENQKDGQS